MWWRLARRWLVPLVTTTALRVVVVPVTTLVIVVVAVAAALVVVISIRTASPLSGSTLRLEAVWLLFGRWPSFHLAYASVEKIQTFVVMLFSVLYFPP